jgi:hypothetical protein
MANVRISFHNPIIDGIVPVNIFDPALNWRILLDHIFIISNGIVPNKLLRSTENFTRLVHFDNVVGIVPVSILLDKSRFVNAVNKPILGWIAPAILFLGNVIDVIVRGNIAVGVADEVAIGDIDGSNDDTGVGVIGGNCACSADGVIDGAIDGTVTFTDENGNGGTAGLWTGDNDDNIVLGDDVGCDTVGTDNGAAIGVLVGGWLVGALVGRLVGVWVGELVG